MEEMTEAWITRAIICVCEKDVVLVKVSVVNP